MFKEEVMKLLGNHRDKTYMCSGNGSGKDFQRKVRKIFPMLN